MQKAAALTFQIAAIAAVLSTIIATMAALGTTRRAAFRGQTAVFVLINQPIIVPGMVTAAALLIFFATIKVATGYQGLGYLILAHTAFCIPFAYLPIRTQLEGMDPAPEVAAGDLYASPWQTLRKVTLPLLTPGVVAAKPSWIAMDYGMVEKLSSNDVMAAVNWNGSTYRARLNNPDVAHGYPVEGYCPLCQRDLRVRGVDARGYDNRVRSGGARRVPRSGAVCARLPGPGDQALHRDLDRTARLRFVYPAVWGPAPKPPGYLWPKEAETAGCAPVRLWT